MNKNERAMRQLRKLVSSAYRAAPVIQVGARMPTILEDYRKSVSEGRDYDVSTLAQQLYHSSEPFPLVMAIEAYKSGLLNVPSTFIIQLVAHYGLLMEKFGARKSDDQ